MIFAGFICFLWLLQTVESATTQSQNNLPSKETTCNINNYYSFHAGPKLEKIIIEMKTKLEAIEQELKNLSKKEETRKKGWFRLQFSFECRHFYKICIIAKLLSD